MDEIFGYMPPVSNPPSKKLFLTLLKQARAYGLGLVLATQNPVDLDYRGLLNTGTWFIGRLQTERDKSRVMEGLEGASDGDFDKQAMERTLAGLGKRRFLLHNVHEDEAVVFGTRWVLSYLAGPLTRDNIKSLMSAAKTKVAAAVRKVSKPKRRVEAEAPALPPEVEQVFIPSKADEIVYHPRLIAAADMLFNSARYRVETESRAVYAVEFEVGPVDIDWDNSDSLSISVDDLRSKGHEAASYAALPAAAGAAKSYVAWGRDFKRWVRQNETITLYRSKKFRLTSEAGETEGDFRARLQVVASEKRDLAIAKNRARVTTGQQEKTRHRCVVRHGNSRCRAGPQASVEYFSKQNRHGHSQGRRCPQGSGRRQTCEADRSQSSVRHAGAQSRPEEGNRCPRNSI